MYVRGEIMRYLITFSYDGTNYSGYQKQKGKYRSLQQHCASALVFTLSQDVNGKYQIMSYKRVDGIKMTQ